MTDVYRVKSDGGTPMPVAGDRYASEFMAAPAPNGDAVAIVGRGMALSQWWRKGHSHLDESELWLVRPDASGKPQYEELTQRDAKQQWPMWSQDGSKLYFVSDKGGAQNLWERSVSCAAKSDCEPRSLTNFDNGRVLWPTISADGRAIAFERDFGIWTYDIASNQARQVSISLRAAVASTTDEHQIITTGFQDLVVSPDGKK